MPTHTAIAAIAQGDCNAIQVETEKPGPGHVLVKVAYASMIAFDTYITDLAYAVVEFPVILGLNASGTVAAVGEGVTSLAVGDTVTGFALYGRGRKDGPKGTMQEFATFPVFQCAKIPSNITLDAAATIPDNFITSFFSLFDQLGLPIPSSFPTPSPPADHDTPILVYGASSTTGQYSLQLLRAAGYTNVAATASPKHHAFLRTLGAAHVFDYASPTLPEDVARTIGGDGKFALVLDTITAEGTLARVAQVVRPSGSVALLLPIKGGDDVATDGVMYHTVPEMERNPFAPETKLLYVRTFTYPQNAYLRDNLMPRILPELLTAGIIQPNRVRLLDQGTFKERVAIGLDLLRNNKISGEKLIVKVPQ
ncbi:chaperonin 10-like protein [Mycena metata]|uniref:Chaperonin 10-like protein n=1 Tax=Mycena metata TaxID=1033252 RepID=A0AAD7M867_9AGAR|nr:chaperonin 10-like protein [Mycena metata]